MMSSAEHDDCNCHELKLSYCIGAICIGWLLGIPLGAAVQYLATL